MIMEHQSLSDHLAAVIVALLLILTVAAILGLPVLIFIFRQSITQ
jgi:hypothetical protein